MTDAERDAIEAAERRLSMTIGQYLTVYRFVWYGEDEREYSYCLAVNSECTDADEWHVLCSKITEFANGRHGRIKGCPIRIFKVNKEIKGIDAETYAGRIE